MQQRWVEEDSDEADSQWDHRRMTMSMRRYLALSGGSPHAVKPRQVSGWERGPHERSCPCTQRPKKYYNSQLLKLTTIQLICRSLLVTLSRCASIKRCTVNFIHFGLADLHQGCRQVRRWTFGDRTQWGVEHPINTLPCTYIYFFSLCALYSAL